MSRVEKKRKVETESKMILLLHPKSKKWYELSMDKLGSGGYGSVFKGKTQTGQYVAMKYYDLTVTDYEEVLQEYTVQKYLNDKRVHGLCRIIDSPFKVTDAPPIGYYIVMELIDGVTLNRCIDVIRTKTWTLKDALKMSNTFLDFMRQLAHIVQRIHKESVVHYDIKPANIMIQNDQLVLIDFGLSCFRKDCKHMTESMKKFVCRPYRTTRGYTPPEIANHNVNAEDYDFRLVDVYSLGKVCVDIATGIFCHTYPTKFQEELHTTCDLPKKFQTNNEGLNHVIEVMIMEPYTSRPDMDTVIAMLHDVSIETPFPIFNVESV